MKQGRLTDRLKVEGRPGTTVTTSSQLLLSYSLSTLRVLEPTELRSTPSPNLGGTRRGVVVPFPFRVSVVRLDGTNKVEQLRPISIFK